MPTTEQYLNQLVSDKSNLVNNLTTKGVEASIDETFTSLVPKVLDISGGGEPNIFIQTIEPEKKDGIWIKSNMTYSNVVIDEDIYNENTWKSDIYPVVAYNTSQQNATTFKYNGDLYMWYADLNNYGLYKYNPEASAFTKLTLTLVSGDPKKAEPYGGVGTIIDNYFVLYSPYNFGGTSDIVKINLDTLEITEANSNITGDTYGYGTYSTYYNGYFYEFGAQRQSTFYYDKVRKINYSTRVSTLIGYIPYAKYNDSSVQMNCARVDNKVYIFHFDQNTTNGKWEYFDLETETFSQAYNLPSDFCFNSNGNGWSVSVYPKGNTIYMLYNGVWKFDTATRTFTKITSSLPNLSTTIKQSLITEYNGDLILISGNRTTAGTTAWSKDVNKFRLTNKTYNNGDVIIRQGIGNYVLYNTSLFDFDSTGKLMFPVSDVFLYNNNQLYSSLPTYIGDGTTWNLI